MFIGLFKTDTPFKIFPLEKVIFITVTNKEITVRLKDNWIYTCHKDCIIKTLKEINYDFRNC